MAFLSFIFLQCDWLVLKNLKIRLVVLFYCTILIGWEKDTVEPGFNEPLFNEVLTITNDILRPGQSYSKIVKSRFYCSVIRE